MKLQWPFRRGSVDAEAKGVMFTPALAGFEFPFGAPRAPGSNVDYATEVRNGMYSSVITSALCWMMRTFPEAPLVVQRSIEERWENVAGHDLAKLIRRPNKQYGGRVLWMATIMDFCFGEAYWLKVRNGNGEVVELWWAPRALMTPMSFPESPGSLDYYRYHPGQSAPIELQPRDVVHFRFGIDPNNILRANFTAAILKNLGIVGIVFSPKDGMIQKEQAESLKSDIQSRFTGERRGQAMMVTGAMDVKLLQYNLQGFDVGPIRDIVEERVSAALAIPAAVIGFGTGLQQTKVGATMREMVKLAWQGGIEPNQAIMADELDRSLLPEFQKNPDLFRTWFDTSQVEALTESPKEKTDRVVMLVEKNIIKVTQGQRELGYPVDPTQDDYMRELTPATAVPDTTPAPDPGDGTAPPTTSDGGSNA
jgi:hypothetical protein